MDEKFKEEIMNRLSNITEFQSNLEFDPEVPEIIKVAIMSLHEVAEVSGNTLNELAKTISQSYGTSEQTLASEMMHWFDGPIDQPPPIQKEMSLLLGYLANFYLHSKLCNELLKGPNNIVEVVASISDIQKALLRLTIAGISSDPATAANRAIIEVLKRQTQEANNAARQKGNKTKQIVLNEWENLKRKDELSKSSAADHISKKTGISKKTIQNILYKLPKMS